MTDESADSRRALGSPALARTVYPPAADQCSAGDVHTCVLAVVSDIIALRRVVGDVARELFFTPTDRTRAMTATSEIARNAIVHGGGGGARLDSQHGSGAFVRVLIADEGAGITDVAAAMRGGASAIGARGLGLNSAQILAAVFAIETAPGRGTKVTMTFWRRSEFAK